MFLTLRFGFTEPRLSTAEVFRGLIDEQKLDMAMACLERSSHDSYFLEKQEDGDLLIQRVAKVPYSIRLQFCICDVIANKPESPQRNAAWHTIVKDPRLAPVVGQIVAQYPKLAEWQDEEHRTAYTNAIGECRKAMDTALAFLTRCKYSADICHLSVFSIIILNVGFLLMPADRVEKEVHRSATCVVFEAIDIAKLGQPPVALKLMFSRQQFECEVETRLKHDISRQYVIGILRVHISSEAEGAHELRDRWRSGTDDDTPPMEVHLEEDYSTDNAKGVESKYM